MACGEVAALLHKLLISLLDRNMLSPYAPASLSPGRDPGTDYMLGGTLARLDVCDKEKISSLYQDLKLRLSST
jgi:hypothetical protein